jgi:hypothetical protein
MANLLTAITILSIVSLAFGNLLFIKLFKIFECFNLI